MTRSAAALIVALTIGLMAGQRLPQAQSASPANIPGEAVGLARAQGAVRVLVRLNVPFSPESSLGAARAASQRAAIASAQSAVLARTARPGRVARRFSFVPYVAVEVDEADLQILAAQPQVREIRIDRLFAPTRQESRWLTEAARAASEQYRGHGVSVAVLDTGVATTHPDLAGRVVSEACYSSAALGSSETLCPDGAESSTRSGSGQPCGLSGCEHGTHVAAIAAGAGGVATEASIISIQVYSAVYRNCGWDPIPCIRAYDSDVIAGLERVYALRNTFDIAAVNLSLGRKLASASCDDEPHKAIIDQLRSAGIATVAAAGNDGWLDKLAVPACISSAISVGSTTDGSSSAPADQISAFTNSSAQLTLLAPGEAITSAIPGGGYANLSGTSQAAPHVTGAWAILRGVRTGAGVSEIATALAQTGKPLFDPRNQQTKPRIRIMAALFAIAPSCRVAVSPTSLNVARSGGTVLITVSPNIPTCEWSVANSDATWITTPVESAARLGPQTFAVTVAPNPSGRLRIGTVTIAGVPVRIVQAGGVAGDINGDDRADLVWQHNESGSLAVWHLNEHVVTGIDSFSIGSVADPQWHITGSGDLNGDGRSDLVWRHGVSGAVAVWYLSGTHVMATLPTAIDRVADTDWRIRGVGDTNADGYADLIWQHRTGGWVAVWLMAGTDVLETRLLSIDRVADTAWAIAAAGDVDGDGRADIIWQHQSTGALGIWFMNGAQVVWTTPVASEPVSDPGWKIRGAGDTNGDGRADLLWRHDSTGAVGVWFMMGRDVLEQRLVDGGSQTALSWILVGPG